MVLEFDWLVKSKSCRYEKKPKSLVEFLSYLLYKRINSYYLKVYLKSDYTKNIY